MEVQQKNWYEWKCVPGDWKFVVPDVFRFNLHWPSHPRKLVLFFIFITHCDVSIKLSVFFSVRRNISEFQLRKFSIVTDSDAALCSRYKYICFVFPQDVLTTHSGLLFITLGAQLVNDDSPECRKMVAHCLKTMLERLHRDARNQLFDVVIAWLKDKKVCIVFYLVECFLKM